MKSECEDDKRTGGKPVYNLNNVTVEVDSKCILVVQIYYRVFVFCFFLNIEF